MSPRPLSKRIHKMIRWMILLWLSCSPVLAQASINATILPNHYLRKFDPITVIFDKSVGPVKGGPEDRGSRYLKIRPRFPGAYRWIDARTLEFRPAVAWPALSRLWVSIPRSIRSRAGTRSVKSSAVILRTLLPKPSQMAPAVGSQDVQNVRKIQLTFPQALPTSRLQRALQIELHALPGVKGSGQRSVLAPNKWSLKRITSANTSQVGYWLLLSQPLPKAHKVTIHLRLALRSQNATEVLPLWSGSFRTQMPFRIKAIRCAQSSVSVGWGTTQYPQERALNCGGQTSVPTLIFTRALGTNNPGALRRLVRISPTVSNLQPELHGHTLTFKGQYRRDVLYRLTIQGQGLPIIDDTGQNLQHKGQQHVFFYLSKKRPFLRWERGKGIFERHGPQMMPIHARNIKKIDLRIYKIPPGDQRFWPFPKTPISVDETVKPPAPGETPPKPFSYSRGEMQERIKSYLRLLGTPLFSGVVTLPPDPEGQGHRFGLDLSKVLKPLLPKLGRKAKKGSSFLLGLRLLDGSSQRRYVWSQVTDLSLTTVEEHGKVRFVVTSLKTARPVATAEILLEEGDKTSNKWNILWKGKTDAKGIASLIVGKGLAGRPTRIRIKHQGDQLVLDTHDPPPVFYSNHWWPSANTWLSWLNDETKIAHTPRYRAHVFVERPVFRPGEPVHIKGFVRELVKGKLALPKRQGDDVVLRIEGPENKKWEYSHLALTPLGGFYRKFSPTDPISGSYKARLIHEYEEGKERVLATRRFRIEEYRIPLFEVRLMSATHVPSDRPFQISVMGRYYAGGLVVDRPVQWRVTSTPIRYRPPGLKDVHFASSYRYGRGPNEGSKVIIDRKEQLNAQGLGTLKLDPTRSLDIRPHRYDIEAVITGTDGRDITGRRSLLLLPPFNVGIQLKDRFRLSPGLLDAQFVAVNFNGKMVKGIPMEVELLRREWHSHLVETDFVKGGVKYQTQIVDKPVGKCKVTSASKMVRCPLKAKRSGVYILRVRARDKMGRLQSVSVDLYVKGTQSLTWERPDSGVFKLTPAQKRFDVGQVARILLRSPFQSARALAIIEDPSGTRYRWLDVKGGQGLLQIPIKTRYAPSLPVHVVLMQGRVSNVRKRGVDPGRPRTVVSSIWLPVTTKKNRIMLAMKMPRKALPGKWVDVTLRMRTPEGRPLAGEVTFWVVDRAVLSLGREGPLNPIDAFIKAKRPEVRIRDTRNLVLGRIPRRPDYPGGDADGAAGGKGFVVRKNFKSVAYYNPTLRVGKSGKLHFRFRLPDDLTTFAVRAVAISGNHRFGYGHRKLHVRLPVMIQRTLPRFVRPGDRFLSGGIARVTEGPGGPAHASVKAVGLQIDGPSSRKFKLHKLKALPIFFPFITPTYFQKQVSVQLQIRRLKDKSSDAFRLPLPVRLDRKRVYFVRERMLTSVNNTFQMASSWPEAIRLNSGKIEVLVAARGDILRSVAALEYLMSYPYGCTEQRVSRAYPMLVLEQILRKFALKRLPSKKIHLAIKQTLRYLQRTIRRDGFYGYWPGSRGYVWLTAYTIPFILEAKRAGYAFPKKLLDRSLVAMRRSLRSDYSIYLDYYQRESQTMVLWALSQAGRHEPGYVRNLYSQRASIDLFGRSRLLLAMLRDKIHHPYRIRSLTKELWDHVLLQQDQGGWNFKGIRFYRSRYWYGISLSTRTRTVAGLLEALSEASPKDPRLDALKNGLLSHKNLRRFGYGLHPNGQWGSTQENAQALLALRSLLVHQQKRTLPKLALLMSGGKGKKRWQTSGQLGGKQSEIWSSQQATDTMPSFHLKGTQPKGPIWFRTRYSYIPKQQGFEAGQLNKGFSVQRSTEVVKKRGGSRYYEIKAGLIKRVAFGALLEETVKIMTPTRRYHVALELPLASGLEVMNPSLKTTASEAKTTHTHTLRPTHQEYLDDRIRFFFEDMPAGTHTLYFRVKATTTGRFTYPPAHAGDMYRPNVFGRSPGYTLIIEKPKAQKP